MARWGKNEKDRKKWEKEDWMPLIEIKKKNERKMLNDKYFPQLSKNKFEDICEICNRYFY